jgi:hypothetical protein
VREEISLLDDDDDADDDADIRSVHSNYSTSSIPLQSDNFYYNFNRPSVPIITKRPINLYPSERKTKKPHLPGTPKDYYRRTFYLRTSDHAYRLLDPDTEPITSLPYDQLPFVYVSNGDTITPLYPSAAAPPTPLPTSSTSTPAPITTTPASIKPEQQQAPSATPVSSAVITNETSDSSDDPDAVTFITHAAHHLDYWKSMYVKHRIRTPVPAQLDFLGALPPDQPTKKGRPRDYFTDQYSHTQNCITFLKAIFSSMRRTVVHYQFAYIYLTDPNSYSADTKPILQQAADERLDVFQPTSNDYERLLVLFIDWFVHTFASLDEYADEATTLAEIAKLSFPTKNPTYLMNDSKLLFSTLLQLLSRLRKPYHCSDEYKLSQLERLVDTIPVNRNNPQPKRSKQLYAQLRAYHLAHPNSKLTDYAITLNLARQMGHADDELYAQLTQDVEDPPPAIINPPPAHESTRPPRRTVAAHSALSNTAGMVRNCPCCGQETCTGVPDVALCPYLWVQQYNAAHTVAMSFNVLKRMEAAGRNAILEHSRRNGCLQQQSEDGFAAFKNHLDHIIANPRPPSNLGGGRGSYPYNQPRPNTYNNSGRGRGNTFNSGLQHYGPPATAHSAPANQPYSAHTTPQNSRTASPITHGSVN